MCSSMRMIVGIVTPAATPTTTITSDSATPTTSPATGTIATMPSNPTRRPGRPGTANASSSIQENRRTHGGSGRELGTFLPRLRRISCQAERRRPRAVGARRQSGGRSAGCDGAGAGAAAWAGPSAGRGGGRRRRRRGRRRTAPTAGCVAMDLAALDGTHLTRAGAHRTSLAAGVERPRPRRGGLSG